MLTLLGHVLSDVKCSKSVAQNVLRNVPVVVHKFNRLLNVTLKQQTYLTNITGHTYSEIYK